jgi:hypothetical protein
VQGEVWGEEFCGGHSELEWLLAFSLELGGSFRIQRKDWAGSTCVISGCEWGYQEEGQSGPRRLPWVTAAVKDGQGTESPEERETRPQERSEENGR